MGGTFGLAERAMEKETKWNRQTKTATERESVSCDLHESKGSVAVPRYSWLNALSY